MTYPSLCAPYQDMTVKDATHLGQPCLLIMSRVESTLLHVHITSAYVLPHVTLEIQID